MYDKSILLSWEVDIRLLFIVFPPANSSSEISVMSTEHGIILYSMVTYGHEDLRVGWLHKYVK